MQELLDEVFAAVQRRFGNTVLIHLEDMQYENMSKTMAQYSGSFPIFSDDIQGMAHDWWQKSLLTLRPVHAASFPL